MKPRLATFFTGGTISMRIDPATGGAIPMLSGEEIIAQVPANRFRPRRGAALFGHVLLPHEPYVMNESCHVGPELLAPGTTAALTDEQAFDVAAYVNSQPRPVKPKLEADFPARKNKPVDAAFAPYTPGFSAEQHKYGPWQPILDARQRGSLPPL